MTEHTGRVFIIAEAGVNHGGDLDLAKKMVDAAENAGADAVKFQTFIAEEGISAKAAKAAYQMEATGREGSQLEMVKALELSFSDFLEIQAHCRRRGILFLSTPFDLPSIDFLSGLGMPFWKIPSGEITHLPYLIRIAQTGKPVVMSTGMATMEEVLWAVEVLTANGAGPITLLHCNTEYPTPFADVNLRAMETLRRETGLPVGYSDHTVGVEASVAAVAMGAVIIEKHFTLDKSQAGPDHRASLDPAELKSLVLAVRHVEQALGTGDKSPSASELKNREVARKSLVARKEIRRGTVFTEENIAVKRPGTGISPARWFEVIGREAKRDFKEDELIEL